MDLNILAQIFVLVAVAGTFIYGAYTMHMQDKMFNDDEIEYMNLKK